jgi:hypothetical protein
MAAEGERVTVEEFITKWSERGVLHSERRQGCHALAVEQAVAEAALVEARLGAAERRAGEREIAGLAEEIEEADELVGGEGLAGSGAGKHADGSETKSY